MLIYPIFMPQAGCPGTCIYCDQSKISGADSFDLKLALREIRQFVSRNPSKEKQIAFFGGSFTALDAQFRDTLKEAVLPILDDKCSIRISTHPVFINKELLDWCLGFRVRTIELGIQDFDDEVLRLSGREYDGLNAFEACNSVKGAGFELGVQLMPGLPGSSELTLEQNKAALQRLLPQYLRIYPVVVIKETELENLWKAGAYQPLSLDDAIRICADLWEFCEAQGIKVIKMGLPSNLNADEVATGPYHPAFGEFVKAELLIRKIELDSVTKRRIILTRQQAALLKGHGQKYLRILQDRLESCSTEIIFE